MDKLRTSVCFALLFCLLVSFIAVHECTANDQPKVGPMRGFCVELSNHKWMCRFFPGHTFDTREECAKVCFFPK
ncbi:hypothetical protein H6P81_020998 [Aristolochia fimbriata]|uniref:Uncharacterized protein n=1 Tax=Aristolochia fimbriata TaxID=158543 RepID=A0AAV7DWX9_ARIFI|nr:hypothetical protein H6P81_020998 [Aristolochia fimbriata]